MPLKQLGKGRTKLGNWMQIIQMGSIKHKGKWDGGWEKREDRRHVFRTLFSSEKNGRKNSRNGLGKLLEEGNITRLGNAISIGSWHFRDFGIEARIPGDEFKSHNRGKIPSTSQYPAWITTWNILLSVFGKAKSLD